MRLHLLARLKDAGARRTTTPVVRENPARLTVVDFAEGARQAHRHVEPTRAAKARDLLATNGHLIGAQTPPRTRGNPDAWEDIIDWGTQLVSEMAAGSSPYLAGRA